MPKPIQSLSVMLLSLTIPPSDNKVNFINKKAPKPFNVKKLYTQASKANILPNIEDVLQIKEAFPTLLANEVTKIIKAENSSKRQKKSKINMMTKGLSRKQIITSMAKSNAELIINSANQQITNINKSLKEFKSDITADFICIINDGVIIATDKLANTSNLKIIEKYIKNIKEIKSDTIESSYLSKFKLYLKIIGLLYIVKHGSITLDIIEGIFKKTYIFNDIILASKLHVIKALPKLNIAVVWVNIWDLQSGSAAKNIINQQFNVGQYIATIYGANTNTSIPQCKNCWKLGHLTLNCYSHMSRCTKCNRVHLTKHHREKA